MSVPWTVLDINSAAGPMPVPAVGPVLLQPKPAPEKPKRDAKDDIATFLKTT